MQISINSISVVVFGRGFSLVSNLNADFVSMLEVRMEMRWDLARHDCRKSTANFVIAQTLEIRSIVLSPQGTFTTRHTAEWARGLSE
jgi:hypothetical protein